MKFVITAFFTALLPAAMLIGLFAVLGWIELAVYYGWWPFPR